MQDGKNTLVEGGKWSATVAFTKSCSQRPCSRRGGQPAEEECTAFKGYQRITPILLPRYRAEKKGAISATVEPGERPVNAPAKLEGTVRAVFLGKRRERIPEQNSGALKVGARDNNLRRQKRTSQKTEEVGRAEGNERSRKEGRGKKKYNIFGSPEKRIIRHRQMGKTKKTGSLASRQIREVARNRSNRKPTDLAKEGGRSTGNSHRQ